MCAPGNWDNRITAELPMSPAQMTQYAQTLGLETLENAEILLNNVDVVGTLDNYLPLFDKVTDYQMIMERLADSKALRDNTIDRFHAALETEMPRTVDDVLQIAANIDRYTLIGDPARYDDGNRVRVRCDGGWVCNTPPLTVSKLYQPFDAWLDGRRLEDGEVLPHLEAIDKTLREKHILSSHPRGMALYNEEYNAILYRRAHSAHLGAEEHGGKPLCVMTMQTYGPLNPMETEYMKTLFSCGVISGWGESDRPVVACGQGRLVIHFTPSETPVYTWDELQKEMAGGWAQYQTPHGTAEPVL